MQTAQKHIVITPGEPAGIGPDLCIMLAQKKLPCRITLAADPDLLSTRAEQLGLPLKLEHVEEQKNENLPYEAGTAGILPVSLKTTVQAGKLNTANSEYVLETLRKAVQGCQEKTFHALVTGPVHKGVINDAGIPFSGHTEFLAELCHSKRVVMMLATTGLRVALATTHLPLREVSDAITPTLLEEVIRILHNDLGDRLGMTHPRILVCGLNPHAGESGHLGREEIDIIAPVLENLRQEHMNLVGPLPADTLFVPKYLREADAVLAMYHDQGLPVLKHMGFGNAVNITLGLPIIRTSVDHGTALDLAGSGKADSGSLETAILTALEMR